MTDAAAPDPEEAEERELAEGRAGLWRLVAVALAAGALTGVVGGAFRLVLREAERGRASLIGDLRGHGVLGVLVPVVAVAACAAAARWLVRLVPEAGGSGVQRVEGVMRGEFPPARARVLPAKFVGGALALGSGLVLGREGPTVQMGATIGDGLALRARLGGGDLRRVQAAAAGAGLGVAFSAPVGGALFTFEEVARAFTLRLAVATLVAASTAIGISYAIIGRTPVYRVAAPPVPDWHAAVPVVVLGVLLGALGVLYNRLVIGFLNLADRLSSIPPEVRAAAIGAVVGLVLRLQPDLVGGGDPLNQRVLDGSQAVLALCGILALRGALGPLSYAAGTPGGLFAPLLLIGSAAGVLFATALNDVWPALHLDPAGFGIVGMATFFSAVVRAPLTGVALIVEMTATTTQAVPMLGAAAVAAAVATGLRGAPIYDTLRLRTLRQEQAAP